MTRPQLRIVDPQVAWIHDNCTDGNLPDDRSHAEGILGLHATCTPPCPRKTVAARYVQEDDRAQRHP